MTESLGGKTVLAISAASPRSATGMALIALTVLRLVLQVIVVRERNRITTGGTTEGATPAALLPSVIGMAMTASAVLKRVLRIFA
jgi:hypothetical protein